MLSAMGAALLGVWLAATPVVFLDGATGADAAQTRAVIDALAQAIEARTGAAPDRAERAPDCASIEACARATGGDLVIIVRVIAAVTTTRVLLQALDGARTTVDLLPDPGGWPAAIDAGLTVILPARIAEQRPSAWVPWTLLGAGLVSGAIGTAFGASASSANGDLEQSRPSADTRALLDRSGTHGAVADVLWVTAVLSVVAGMVWFALEP